MGLEVGLSSGAENDRSAGFFGQVDMPRHEVGVKVSFQDVFDPGIVLGCTIEVRLRFAQRVDDDGFAFTFDVVGGFGQTSGIQLFNFHRGDFFTV